MSKFTPKITEHHERPVSFDEMREIVKYNEWDKPYELGRVVEFKDNFGLIRCGVICGITRTVSSWNYTVRLPSRANFDTACCPHKDILQIEGDNA